MLMFVHRGLPEDEASQLLKGAVSAPSCPGVV